MFQPETEDMLPRMAPKPSAAMPPGANDGIIMPQVPEVSILFGQQEGNMQQRLDSNTGIQQLQLTNKSQPTYADWKKHMLPKVTFPATANVPELQLLENNNNNNNNANNNNTNNIIIQDYNTQRTNLYPFRSVADAGLSMTPTSSSNGGIVAIANNPTMYRRSLENCNGHLAYQQIRQSPLLQSQPTLVGLKPIVTQSQKEISKDVLTICAGTQTDMVLDSSNNMQSPKNVPWSNFATKKDVDDVRQILEEMKNEQKLTRELLETLIRNTDLQNSSKPQTCDVAIQIESIENDNQVYGNDGIELTKGEVSLQTIPKNKFIQHLKPTGNVLQTPKDKPIAQSTTYRTNTPQFQRLQENLQEVAYQQVCNKLATSMPKPTSDTSLAMNELALKYLPNEKLAELLKELNMDYPLGANTTQAIVSTTAVRSSKDKFEKGPSDISNASYKYLKKYRLLPEDHEDDIASDDIESENHMPQFYPPQYNIRNASINQRQTPTKKNLPYTGRLPLTPLANASSSPTVIPQHVVDLENIKLQPKLL